MSSQIVNLKVIEGVLVLRKCYQCGGETLVPVVKHPLHDSNIDIYADTFLLWLNLLLAQLLRNPQAKIYLNAT